MEQPKVGLARRLTAAGMAARRVWQMIGDDQMPVLVEAETLKDLAIEDEGWSLVSGGNPRTDLPTYEHADMLKKAYKYYRENHMSKALLGIIVDFVWGDGISVTARHENESTQQELQDAIDEFWEDPINSMDRKMESRIHELHLWGELLMPVQVNEDTGHVRIGWIDPHHIEAVTAEPTFGRPKQVVLTDQAAESTGYKALDVVKYDPDQDTIDGNCFFYAINSTMSSRRGVSELYTAGDWLDTIDETLKAHSDRAKVDAHFIWDVLLHGASDQEIKNWYKNHGKAPGPNSVRAHNEKVEWKAVSPQLGSADMAGHIQILKSYVMGGFRYPNHWYASGDDANLATAAAMNEPTRKHLKKKQKMVAGIIADMVRFALYMRQKVGGSFQGVDFVRDKPFEVQIPDLATPDMAKIGAAVTQVTSGTLAARDAELISQETAQDIFAAVGTLLGIEIDPAHEREQIEAEQEREQDDEEELQRRTNERIADQLRMAAGNGSSSASFEPEEEPTEV